MQNPPDLDTLNNGVSYFVGPLLNWTLVGVIRALVGEIHRQGYVLFLLPNSGRLDLDLEVSGNNEIR